MKRVPVKRALLLSAVGLALLTSLGGGGTYVALAVTTRPEFCRTCHIMEPYYASWASSSHKHVNCVDCHFEPGLLETFEGKWKAMSQLAKYVTATQGSKPWAEVSDASCLRSGCHSERLLDGEIQFGRIRFDHGPHLTAFRRGKQLRCTSCHSQIVQGEHLTVTTSTCILCHFRVSDEGEAVADCNTCHGPPSDEIRVEGAVFRHSEYIERGVQCRECHADVTRGDGAVPRDRCISCHNRPEQFERYDDVEFLHLAHVTNHSLTCLQCHTEMHHGLPAREAHFQGDCRQCHVGTHGATSSVYRGTGGTGVPDAPSVMFLARVTCTGCHRPPFAGAPPAAGGTTYTADPRACIECHGPGYDGMASRWQTEVRQTVAKVRAVVKSLEEALVEEWPEGDLPAARGHYDAAARNLGLVLLDKSDGVHNLPYVRALLHRAAEEARAGLRALDPGETPAPIAVGPRVASREDCTTLCHVGIEETAVDAAHGMPFSHSRHLLGAKLDCATCHRAEPHGTTHVKPADCVSCHHRSESPDRCESCHAEVKLLFAATMEGVTPSMRDLDCLACHEGLAQGHSRDAVRAACDACHDDKPKEPDYFAEWLATAEGPLAELEALLPKAPPELREEVARLRRAGPHHNVEYVRARARQLADRLR